MLPFEFVVDGPPVSHQATDRDRLARWRERVREAAAAAWPPADMPETDQLEIAVTYYHEGETVNLDNDNMIKPIQDALAGLVYINDRQITDTRVRKTSLDGAFRIRGTSVVLALAFVRSVEFIHVALRKKPDHTEFI